MKTSKSTCFTKIIFSALLILLTNTTQATPSNNNESLLESLLLPETIEPLKQCPEFPNDCIPQELDKESESDDDGR